MLKNKKYKKKQLEFLKFNNIKLDYKVLKRRYLVYKEIRQNYKKQLQLVKTNPTNNKLKEKDIINERIEYFRFLDGRYKSYWLGKLLNAFILQGKKSLIYNKIYKSFLFLKFNNNINSLLLLFEILEKIKLIFKLKIWYFRKRKGKGKKRKPREKFFPQLISRDKQYLIGLKWILNEIKESKQITKESKAKSLQFSLIKTPFSLHFYEKFLKLTDLTKLLKNRDDYYKRAVYFDYKIRYPWSRKLINYALFFSSKYARNRRKLIWKKRKKYLKMKYIFKRKDFDFFFQSKRRFHYKNYNNNFYKYKNWHPKWSKNRLNKYNKRQYQNSTLYYNKEFRFANKKNKFNTYNKKRQYAVLYNKNFRFANKNKNYGSKILKFY